MSNHLLAELNSFEIRRLAADELLERKANFAILLRDAVESGGCVGFVLPVSDDTLDRYWIGVARELAAGERELLAAFVDGVLVASLQISRKGRIGAASRRPAIADCKKRSASSWHCPRAPKRCPSANAGDGLGDVYGHHLPRRPRGSPHARITLTQYGRCPTLVLLPKASCTTPPCITSPSRLIMRSRWSTLGVGSARARLSYTRLQPFLRWPLS